MSALVWSIAYVCAATSEVVAVKALNAVGVHLPVFTGLYSSSNGMPSNTRRSCTGAGSTRVYQELHLWRYDPFDSSPKH